MESMKEVYASIRIHGRKRHGGHDPFSEKFRQQFTLEKMGVMESDRPELYANRKDIQLARRTLGADIEKISADADRERLALVHKEIELSRIKSRFTTRKSASSPHTATCSGMLSDADAE